MNESLFTPYFDSSFLGGGSLADQVTTELCSKELMNPVLDPNPLIPQIIPSIELISVAPCSFVF